jgi:transcription elongation factor Elf1
MRRKKPVRNVKLNPLRFRCPYCGEDNLSTTPMDTIFIARRRCSHCGEEILIEKRRGEAG